ncbi:hypothetical protein ACWNYQ_00075 [Candidatus Vidania fulgoroideorum]
MYNLVYKYLFLKKINIYNFKKKFLKNNVNILINFFLKNKNFLINIIFKKKYLKKKFFSTLVFNQNYHKILFNCYVSDIIIRKNNLSEIKENLFHSFYHVIEKEHYKKKDYLNMIFTYYIFKKFNEKFF